jgi:hypothetical protein
MPKAMDATEANGGPELDFTDREVVLRADFETVDEDECISTSIRVLMDGPRAPRVGEWVFLIGTGGEGCLGQIESISGWTACVRPDWKTWTGPGEPPLQ